MDRSKQINALTDLAGFLRMVTRESRFHLNALKEHGAYGVDAHTGLTKLARAANHAFYELRQSLSLENWNLTNAHASEVPDQEIDTNIYDAAPEVVTGEIVEDNGVPARALITGPCRVCAVSECGGIDGGCFCTCHGVD